jgi:hypothetical protein
MFGEIVRRVAEFAREVGSPVGFIWLFRIV